MPKTLHRKNKRRTNKRRTNKRRTNKRRTNRTKKMRGGVVNWRAALSGLVLALASLNGANAMPGYTSGVVVDGNKIRMDKTSYDSLPSNIQSQFTTDNNLGTGKYVLETDGCPQIFEELKSIKIQNRDPAVKTLVDNIQATSSCDNTKMLTAPASNFW